VDSRRRPFDRPVDPGEALAGMALHLIKLCVGCDSIDDLVEWIDWRLKELRKARKRPEHAHVTRMVPKRIDALLAGGSLYWVIKGNVQVRQRLLDIRPFVDDDGISRCRLVLDPKPVATDWQPRRAFQGWRYLDAKDAPPDLRAGRKSDLPPALMAELAGLGLR
jgi:hypothetical protein